VKKLNIGSSLTLELSKALESVDEGSVLELLPALQELEVPLKIDRATNAFSMFMKIRESVGRPIHLLVPPEVAIQPSLSGKETVPRPGLKPEKKRWQARALGLVGRLRGKNQN
jgi:hypothetical protein